MLGSIAGGAVGAPGGPVASSLGQIVGGKAGELGGYALLKSDRIKGRKDDDDDDED